MGYKYYDTPMGEDMAQKLWQVTKLSGAAGLAVSTADVILYSYPKGYLQTLGRYAYITGPFMGIAAAYTCGANISASIRKKDDQWNYLVGAVCAGSSLGAWRKSIMVGFVGSIAFTVMGFVLKTSIDEGWKLHNPIGSQLNTVNPKWYDFSLVKERPRDWTTGEE